MHDNLLIVGIDPGITAAYAALNTRGELVKLKSEKHLNLNTIVNELTQAGRIIAVGTDVKYSPKFVEKFCSRLSAKLISPKEDMKIGYKKRLAENFRHHDDHQRDAIAAALFAFNELRPLLKKIDFVLKREGKEHLAYDVTILVDKGMSIADALRRFDYKEDEIKVKKRIRSKIRKSSAFAELNQLLNMENSVLKQKISILQKKIENLSRDSESTIKNKISKILSIKDKKISEANMLVNKQRHEIDLLNRKIHELNEILFSTKNKLVIKHLKTLGFDEVQRTIEKGDNVILVDDVNVFSERSFDYIKDKISTIIFKNNPSKIIDQKSFYLVSAKNLGIEEHDNFAVVDKERLEKEKEKVNVLSKIVKEYKEERHAQL